MSSLSKKIDFALLFTVKNANPNGDPLNGNRPRENYEGYGIVSDVCIKRKIRNRLQDMGECIFVQSSDRSDDGCNSLSERAKSYELLQDAVKQNNEELYKELACKKWFDVRCFGQVFAFKGDSLSVGVRGPVSIHHAVSLNPIDISSMQITKSVNSEAKDKKASDTMGMKHMVTFGLYLVKGSINHQLATKTGFSDDDAEKIKEALRTLFINDASSARPDGSLEVKKLYWWKHNNAMGQYSSAKVHQSLKIRIKDGIEFPNSFDDFEIDVEPLEGLELEIIEGI
ncbi:MAG TPA: type I-C CRISPR-associated protein Cas7/Csd2 [Haloplasmataceae bacterium]